MEGKINNYFYLGIILVIAGLSTIFMDLGEIVFFIAPALIVLGGYLIYRFYPKNQSSSQTILNMTSDSITSLRNEIFEHASLILEFPEYELNNVDDSSRYRYWFANALQNGGYEVIVSSESSLAGSRPYSEIIKNGYLIGREFVKPKISFSDRFFNNLWLIFLFVSVPFLFLEVPIVSLIFLVLALVFYLIRKKFFSPMKVILTYRIYEKYKLDEYFARQENSEEPRYSDVATEIVKFTTYMNPIRSRIHITLGIVADKFKNQDLILQSFDGVVDNIRYVLNQDPETKIGLTKTKFIRPRELFKRDEKDKLVRLSERFPNRYEGLRE